MSPLWSCLLLLSTCLVLHVNAFTKDQLFDGMPDADAKKFVNTSERIWTFSTSNLGDSTPICQLDHYQCNEESSCQLRRRSSVNNRMVEDHFKVTFYATFTHRLENGPSDILLLRNRDTNKLRLTETVMYLSKASTCAVVYVYPGVQGGWVDLRVRQSSIGEEVDTDCYTFFKELVSDHATRYGKLNYSKRVYVPLCQRAYKK